MERQYTTQDVQQIDQACVALRENGFDTFTQDGVQRNADLLDKYFQQNPNVPVTVANIYKLVEAQKANFKWLSPAESEYRKAEAENPAAAAKLSEWFATQGKPGTLENTGNAGFENFAILLTELRGRDVSQTTVQQAIGRIAYNGRRQLHVVPTKHVLSPAAQAAQDHKPGEFVSKTNMVRTADGGWRSKNAAEQAADRRLAEAQKNPAQDSAVIASRAKAEAESLRGNNHREDLQLQRVFVGSPTDWVATLAARKQMQASFSKNRSIR